jgi:class 3 adenylate cyclase/tetratricopeptide (TPR) repeat protein
MRCESCQHENGVDARFCESCGAALQQTCASCASLVSGGARFCPQCGQAQAGSLHATTAGERRPLTVMFCDLVGSTDLANRLDPEELREIVTDFQDACSEAVKRMEGHIAQYLGDGVLVYFGFPHAREDDAERAVRAALDIQSLLVAAQKARSAERGVEVSARIGIHTGPVVMAAFGEGAQQQSIAVGQTIHIASRLDGVAEPGGVAISQATLRLVSGLFVTRDLGTPELKGVAAPLRVFAVDGPAGVGSRLDSSEHLTKLSGRDLELEEFRYRWGQVCKGHGQVLTVAGEAGMGKSRMLRALREELTDAPYTWLESRCAPYSAGTALQPVIELLQAGFRFELDEDPQEKADRLEAGLTALPGVSAEETVPFLLHLLGLPASVRHPFPALGPELLREKTLQALIAPILALAARQPLLIAFEDVHWADPSTLELLGRLVDQAPGLQLLLVVTFRLHFEPPWSQLRPHVCPLTLARLSQEQTRDIVASAAGPGRLPERILDELVARADGVPLFAEELARSVLESGMIVERDGRPEFQGQISDLTIPTTLQGSLMARLDRLSAAKSVAQIAATLGREFPYDLIEEVADVGAAMLRSGLGQLVSAEILFQRGTPPGSTYTFKHTLLQDTAYESQLKRRRRELHARVARVLGERFPARVEAEPALMAHHCAQGGLERDAVTYYQHAAEQAIARLSNVEAVEYFTRALGLLEDQADTPERQQLEIALRVAAAGPQTSIHGYEAAEVRGNVARAEELCEGLGSGPQQLAALVGLSVYNVGRGDLPRASRYAARILEIAEPLGIAPLEVAGHMIVGSAAIASSPIPEACRHLSRAIELAETADLPAPASTYDVDVLTIAHSTYAMALVLAGDPAGSREQVRVSLQRGEALGHLNTLGTALLNSAITGYFHEDPEVCARQAARTLEAVEGRGFHTYESAALVFAGWGRVACGDPQGIQQAAAGVTAAEDSGSMGGLVQLYFTAADAFLLAGHFTRASEYVEAATKAIERTGERIAYEPQAPLLRAAILLGSGGEPAEIERQLDDSTRLWHVFESRWMELRAATLRALLAQRTGDLESACRHLADLCRHFEEAPDTGSLARARRLLAELG